MLRLRPSAAAAAAETEEEMAVVVEDAFVSSPVEVAAMPVDVTGDAGSPDDATAGDGVWQGAPRGRDVAVVGVVCIGGVWRSGVGGVVAVGVVADVGWQPKGACVCAMRRWTSGATDGSRSLPWLHTRSVLVF